MLALALASATAIAAPDGGAMPVVAEDGMRPHSHTHAPAEIKETHGPILLQATYTAEVMGNVSGGIRKGARYLDNLDLVFEADLEQLAGWTGAQVHVYGLYNNGKSISELAGDAQAVSNIETGVRAARLYEAWIDQKFGEVASLRVGLYDLNSEFDALDASGLFLGSPHGIGTDFAQSGQSGPSIFPTTSLAARFEVKPAEGWVIRTAILDGVPGDPARPSRTTIQLGNGDGALLVGEVEAPVAGGRLLLGHWRYTARFETLDGGSTSRGNAGSYIRAELPLIERENGKIHGFARLGTATGRFNMFDRFASAGLHFTGWIPGRSEDQFGLAVAAAFTSDRYRLATGAGDSETVFEATYRTQLAPWLAVQPNVQYVRKPAADPTIDDALVIGLRTEISFDLLGG